jgi:uncharacterized protein YheU (UPF0270 family)
LSDESSVEEQIAIPHLELSPEALYGLVEAFVLREGTDYGVREFSLQEKVAHVLAQLEKGEARVTFDAKTETVSILARTP